MTMMKGTSHASWTELFQRPTHPTRPPDVDDDENIVK